MIRLGSVCEHSSSSSSYGNRYMFPLETGNTTGQQWCIEQNPQCAIPPGVLLEDALVAPNCNGHARVTVANLSDFTQKIDEGTQLGCAMLATLETLDNDPVVKEDDVTLFGEDLAKVDSDHTDPAWSRENVIH